ncbi:MAG TPA: PEP-CTERM sorting domain-containing protein [Gemmatirosa sp.]
MRNLFSAGAALAVAALLARPVAAQITPGSTFTFSGTADANDIGLGGVMLSFAPNIAANTTGNTGSFAAFNAGGTGQIQHIRVGNGAESIPAFLTIGGYRFDVSSLPSGGSGQDACYIDPAPGQTCTPYQSIQGDPSVNAGLSPFYVANLDSGDPTAPINSTAAFALVGTVTGPDGYASSFVGTISSAFPGMPYQYVLYTLEQDGLQDLSFTGSFVVGPAIGSTSGGTASSVTPEPATYALVGFGLVGLAGIARRRRTQRPA